MYILIRNFKADITPDEYEEIAGKDAPIFANIPGLKHKYFLFNHETKIFGGCYLWEDKTSLDAYKAGEIYKSIINNPDFENVTTSEFEVHEKASLTQEKMKN